MKSIPKMIGGIDRMNEAIGRVLCFSLIVIMLIQVMDVVLRYVFNNPTIWAMDMNTMLFTGASMLAGSYALLYDTHVRLDILYRNWGKKSKAYVDLFTGLLALIAIGFVIWKGFDSFWWAWKTNQNANSYWGPPMWPVKLCLPIGAILLLLQGISKWLKLLLTILDRKKGEPS